MLRVSSNSASFRRGVNARKRSVRRVIAMALTETARDVERNTVRRLSRVLDRPTPFTLRGMFVSPASASRLRAIVGFKDIQARYLALQELGGTRQPAGRALVIPAGRTNKYGNLARGAVSRLLARGDTFSGKIGRTAGIWKRTRGGGLQLQVLYASSASYRPRLNYARGAEQTARARFPHHFRSFLRKEAARATLGPS